MQSGIVSNQELPDEQLNWKEQTNRINYKDSLNNVRNLSIRSDLKECSFFTSKHCLFLFNTKLKPCLF